MNVSGSVTWGFENIHLFWWPAVSLQLGSIALVQDRLLFLSVTLFLSGSVDGVQGEFLPGV